MAADHNKPGGLPQQQKKHPDRYMRDLNPDFSEGQNVGGREHLVAASELKQVVTLLDDFNMDELREIPIVRPNQRLQQGATYVDICDPDRAPFKATGQDLAREGQCLVPKAETPYPYWNRLIGMDDPQRTE